MTQPVRPRRSNRGSIRVGAVAVLSLVVVIPGGIWWSRPTGGGGGAWAAKATLAPPAPRPAAGSTTPVDSFGVSVPGLPSDLTALHAFEKMVGRNTSVASYYQDFASGPKFDAASATALWEQGAMPMLAWEPDDSSGPATDQPDYSLASIIDGAHDPLITRWASEIAAWGRPILLRFAPEMNGNWNAWSEGVNGNLAGQYVQAWRHVHDIFTRAGATSVIWVWNPNVSFPGSTALRSLYPGDAYVDMVGLDGYNWGTSQSGSVWQTPAQVFAATVKAVQQLTTRPILICEVASTEVGGNKAAWTSQFFAYLARMPAIRGFVWFDFNKETDWRVNSSPAAKHAFIAGLTKGNFS